MDSNPPANYHQPNPAQCNPNPPPPGAPTFQTQQNQYRPQYNHNQHHTNFTYRPPDTHAFNTPPWKRKFNSSPNASFGSFAKLYVCPVPKTSTEEDIRSVFGQHGKIVEVVFLRDKRTGQPQGNCFVKFATVSDAEAAIHTLHDQHIYPGETESLKVRFADGEQERLGIQVPKLFVKNLNRKATKMEIKELFSKYGEVEDVHILCDELKHSRGMGLIEFSQRYMAEAAINALNGIYFMTDCEYPLLVRFADSKKPHNGDLRYKLPPAHGITGRQVFPRAVHQGPAISHYSPVQTHLTNPSPPVIPPVAHKQSPPTDQCVSHYWFQGQQQSSPQMASCYTNKILPESSQPSPHVLEMHCKVSGPALHLNEEQVTQHQKSEDKLMSDAQNEDLTLTQQQSEGQCLLSQQNTDQCVREQAVGDNSKLHKADDTADAKTAEPATHCVSMISSSLDDIASLDCDWSEHFCPDGNKYYYNSETCQSRWEKPAEYASFEKHVLKLIQNESSYSVSQSLSSQDVLSSH